MACCCKINCKGAFGIVFSNIGFALLLVSFLTCNWLTSPLDTPAIDSTTQGIATGSVVDSAKYDINLTTTDDTVDLATTDDVVLLTTSNDAVLLTTTDDTTLNNSTKPAADELTGVIRCLPESIKLSPDEIPEDEKSYTRYLTYVATIASLIAALSLLGLGDIFLSVYCSFCCCCTCGIITAGGLHIAGSLFNFLGCGIFTYGIIFWNDYQGGSPYATDFGWSYYLAWISALVIFVSGLLETQGVNAKDYTSPSRRQTSKPPANVVYQPRATMNPAYAPYDF